jgi:hypothetical protein
METEKSLKNQVAELIKHYGYEAVGEEVLAQAQIAHPLDGTPPTCPTGYVWDNVLKQCVLDNG